MIAVLRRYFLKWKWKRLLETIIWLLRSPFINSQFTVPNIGKIIEEPLRMANSLMRT